MSVANLQPSSNSGLNLGLFTIPQSFLLQVGTTTLLTALLAEKAATEALIAMGQASEEIFRGDRLPILEFPEKGRPQEAAMLKQELLRDSDAS
ncbi:MAG: hypothetical protein ACHBN1_35160 [Heteroscytonema crispum UTEX LB 1556]